MKLFDDGRGEASSGRCASPAWARRRSCPASRDRGRAGRIRRCRPRGSASTCASCASCSTSTATTPALYGHFGQGCIHCRVDFDLHERRRASNIPRVRGRRRPTWCVELRRHRFRASTATGSRAREFLPKMFGPELMQAFREFKAIWDPDWKMNPGKVVDPYRIDREPAARRRLPIRRQPDDALPVSRRRRQLRAADAALRRASASAAAKAGAARCARATW